MDPMLEPETVAVNEHHRPSPSLVTRIVKTYALARRNEILRQRTRV
jgi:hypothetical protein